MSDSLGPQRKLFLAVLLSCPLMLAVSCPDDEVNPRAIPPSGPNAPGETQNFCGRQVEVEPPMCTFTHPQLEVLPGHMRRCPDQPNVAVSQLFQVQWTICNRGQPEQPGGNPGLLPAGEGRPYQLVITRSVGGVETEFRRIDLVEPSPLAGCRCAQVIVDFNANPATCAANPALPNCLPVGAYDFGLEGAIFEPVDGTAVAIIDG